MGGGDQTVIDDNDISGNPILSITTNANTAAYFRLAGITFEGGSGSVKWQGMVSVAGNSANVRLDHSHFNTTTYSRAASGTGVQFTGCVYGVVDHSIFDNPSGSVNNSIHDNNSGACFKDSLGFGDQSWAHSTSLGSAGFLFAENNIFNSGIGNDCTFGGRFVFRFNTFNMTMPAPSLQTHPTGGAGRIRGCRAWEIYQNHFSAAAGSYINAGFWVSSGTGVVWGNTIPSSSAGGGTGYKTFILLNSMRKNNVTYPQAPTPHGWGYCGTAYKGAGSNWDQNSNATTGYRCMDQPGQGQGDLLTGGFTSDDSGTNNVKNATTRCNSSSACAWVAEALEPVYEWADNYSPVPSNPSKLLGINPYFGTGAFFDNSDYYTWCNPASTTGCTSFTGTSGVGSGTLASRPSTCTTGVAYWAKDQGSWNHSGSGGQGELFVCTITNTWMLYYTPYVYPHPLDD